MKMSVFLVFALCFFIAVVFGSSDHVKNPALNPNPIPNPIDHSSEILLLREELKAQQSKFRELEKSHGDLNEKLEAFSKHLDEVGDGLWLLTPPLRGPPGKKGETGNPGLEGSAGEIQIRPMSVPIGFVYIQLPKQQTPAKLWPNFTWKSITSEYAGLFFRAEGGASASFGVTQDDSTRQIAEIQQDWAFIHSSSFANPLILPKSGWSSYGHVGHYPDNSGYSEGLRYRITNVEVRPQNTAIRIWTRTA